MVGLILLETSLVDFIKPLPGSQRMQSIDVAYTVVSGRVETFRLVGMDHFNAMFKDRTSGSWWRQANGEAVAGDLRGKTLHEIPSRSKGGHFTAIVR